MAIFGFAASVFVMLLVTVAYLMAFFNCMGRYNIGGVQNSLASKVICLAAGAGIAYAWLLVMSAAPFRLVAA